LSPATVWYSSGLGSLDEFNEVNFAETLKRSTTVMDTVSQGQGKMENKILKTGGPSRVFVFHYITR